MGENDAVTVPSTEAPAADTAAPEAKTPEAKTPEAKRDAVLVAAVDVARAAAVEEAGADVVGDHLGVVMEDERLATHTFACLNPAYAGWAWAVTVTRAPRLKSVTVSDVVLLPGPDAIIAPSWVPWSERVEPGDLAPGDVLPTAADDARLIAGLTGEDDLEGASSLAPLVPGQWEIGLGRVRVLRPWPGRRRWSAPPAASSCRSAARWASSSPCARTG